MSEPLTARPIGVRPMAAMTASDMTHSPDGWAYFAAGSSAVTTGRLPSALRSRSSFLSCLPTLVRGTSSTNAHCSGSHHLTTRPDRWARSSSGVTDWPGARAMQASGRSPHRSSGAAMTAASRTAGWVRMAASSSSVEIHSPPDLTTSLARSLIVMKPLGVDPADVAGAQPAVAELLRRRVLVVGGRHPRPAHLDLAGGVPVAGQHLALVVHDPGLHAAERAARGGPVLDGALGRAVLGREGQRRHRAGLGQAPALHDAHAEPLLVGLDQAARHGRPAAQDHAQRGQVDVGRVQAEHVVPHRGHGRGQRWPAPPR